MNKTGGSMNLSLLIKPASSLCNLRCKYCFYADISDLREVRNFGIMKHGTILEILQRVEEYLEEGSNLHIGFQGGEPTLAGLEYFQTFTSMINEKLGPKNIQTTYSMQTNGTNLNKEFCDFLGENRFLVGLSMDVLEELHDMNRIDNAGQGTYTTVVEAQKMLKDSGVEYNILCVLTSEMAKQPKKVWKAIRRSGNRYIQFIPCLNGLTGEYEDTLPITSQLFAEFYSGILPLWYKSYCKKDYVSIRFFDDLFNLLLYRVVNSCGFTGKCTAQLIVEADGSVYPCDFYALDEYKIGDFKNNTIEEMKNSNVVTAFVNDSGNKSVLCENCVYQRMCNGGCKRMTKEMYASQDYCGYQQFLEGNKELIEEILLEIKNNT